MKYFIHNQKKNITDSAIRRLMVEASDCLDDLMILCRADITTKNEMRIKNKPTDPKKCRGRSKYLLVNSMVKRSKKP